MNKSNRQLPKESSDFPEVNVSTEGTMEEVILTIVVNALNAQSYPGLDVESLQNNPLHCNAAIDMLRDCRPLPVILDLIEKIENGRI